MYKTNKTSNWRLKASKYIICMNEKVIMKTIKKIPMTIKRELGEQDKKSKEGQYYYILLYAYVEIWK